MSSQLLFVIFAAFVCSLTSWTAHGLSCGPCDNVLEICGPPPSCYETVLGICACCPVCAKLEGEVCGGTWGELGTCAKGLTCRKSNHASTKWWDTDGICLGPANAQCTKGEGCRQYWSFETGGTVYCCPGRERLVVNGTSGDCICNGTGGNVFSWSEREQFVEGNKLLPTGAHCTIGEGCREHLSCETGGTVHCCPGGERLEVNSTSGVCTCNETGSKEFSCGGGTLGQGYEFLPIKPGAHCTIGEGCREHLSCETGGTVHCCPGGERLEVNSTSGVCTCNETGSKEFSCGGGTLGQGYEFLPIKPGAHCTIGEGCREHLSCETGGTVHCCPGGERLEVNSTSGVCTCNETGSKEFSCGGGTLGQGYEFLPIKPGAHCTIGEGCREHLSCETGGTVHCCPGGERLEVNRTSGVCTCNETGSKEFSCGGGTLGQGYEFLPIKPGARHCTIGEGCREHLSCETGGTVHCCPGEERLEVNSTSGVCTCNETGSKEFSCGGGTLGQGYEFLPIKPGAHCTIGEGCREHLSCETGGTVHCCPGGERLEVNSTSGVCTCNETGSKEFSCGGGTLGQGYEFLPIKPGAHCTIGEGCREHLSCETGGTVHCCPGGERLEVNRTSGVCTCNETGSKEFSCGGGTLGQGYEFLPIKPGARHCTIGEGCREHLSCETGGTVHCCPGGERLEVNSTSGVCTCNETGSKEFSCGGGTLGQGYEFLPIKPGAHCTIGEGCREHLSCETGGTVHCCPGGERLEVNRTSGVCTCNETGSKEFSCGGGTLGQGYEFLPIKPADQDCKKNTTCYGEISCSIGNTRYCCPRGQVTTVSRDGDLQSCSCRYDFSGRSCTTSFALPHVTSASAVTCVAASLVALLFAPFMPDK